MNGTERQTRSVPLPCGQGAHRVRGELNRLQMSPREAFVQRKIVGIILSMGIVCGAADAAQAQNSPAGAAIDAAPAAAIARKDVPGVVALVTGRSRVLYHGAFSVADISTGRALTPDALFRIASMTKPITSVAAMQLVEQGRFGLDDPVEKYLPDFANLKV